MPNTPSRSGSLCRLALSLPAAGAVAVAITTTAASCDARSPAAEPAARVASSATDSRIRNDNLVFYVLPSLPPAGGWVGGGEQGVTKVCQPPPSPPLSSTVEPHIRGTRLCQAGDTSQQATGQAKA